MQVGNRIIFDQDGDIVFQTGEMQGDVLSRKEITELNFIDLDYGAIDYAREELVSVDIINKKVITKQIPIPESLEQQRIRELEDQLILAEDAAAGGIL